MKEELLVTLVETDLAWESPEDNRKTIAQLLAKHQLKSDLFILPEMFTSGFTMNPEAVAEPMTGPTISWLKQLSAEHQAGICGSLVIEDGQHYVNRFVCVSPEGDLWFYDKKHTFTLAGEHKAYKAGAEKVVFNYQGWSICPMICYDLRFPVWSRNAEDYDLLVYVANWPKPRINAWDALLKARAIENMSYCIGVNRIGFDGNGHEYPGHSNAYDVLGNTPDIQIDSQSGLKQYTLHKSSISKFRSKLNFLGDRDRFHLVQETHTQNQN